MKQGKRLHRTKQLVAITVLCFIAKVIANTPTIEDISIIGSERGLVLMVKANTPIRGNVDNQDRESVSDLNISFRGARYGLDHNEFKRFQSSIPVSELLIKENKETSQIDLALNLSSSVAGPIEIRHRENEMLVLLTRDAHDEFRWDASLTIISEHSSSEIDIEQMEKRAVEDASKSIPEDKVFSVGEKTTEKAKQSAASKKATTESSRAAVESPTPEFEIAPPSQQEEIKEVTREKPDGRVVRYRVFGRDPFVSLYQDTSAIPGRPRVESLRLVGILEDSEERIALFENFRDDNRAYALREEDRVDNGHVLRIYRDRVVFLIRDFDVSRSYTLNLTEKPDARNVRRR
ncbi:hypothetical protein QA601_04620 [Chitinispirillales bacterium ANBcel5]|uniref:hypothetical protein n=1 Tax=Cellulosispirillum alkaliphilum TaxID=3039283 RepID=UPI002A5505B5|nr:hypothetical protein [Chitinispirillales bacterium ANBcel5]